MACCHASPPLHLHTAPPLHTRNQTDSTGARPTLSPEPMSDTWEASTAPANLGPPPRESPPRTHQCAGVGGDVAAFLSMGVGVGVR